MDCYKVQVKNLDTLEVAVYERYYGRSGATVRQNAIRRLRRNGFLGKGHRYEVTMWWVEQ